MAAFESVEALVADLKAAAGRVANRIDSLIGAVSGQGMTAAQEDVVVGELEQLRDQLKALAGDTEVVPPAE